VRLIFHSVYLLAHNAHFEGNTPLRFSV
jgi:hypothetical protein